MNKEVISDKQGIAILVLFIIGESSILVSGINAGKDLWMAIIIALVMALPLIYIYSKLYNIYPDKDIFYLIEKCFGKVIGKIVIFLYTWFAFELTALVARNLGQFVNTVSFPETPFIVPTIGVIILCGWIVREGIEVIGRCADFFVLLPIALVLVTIILLIPNMNIENVRPMLFKGIEPIIKSSYEVFIYPFCETVIFIFAISSLKNKKSIGRIYFKSTLIGGAFLLLLSLTIVLVLGMRDAANNYYPGYLTFTRVNIGSFLQRIEIVSSILFLLGIFIKTSVYLLATCKGFAALFGVKDYRFIVIPICLLAVNFAYFSFDGVMSYNEWIFDVWIYYAFLFMVIIPVVILIISKLRKLSSS